MIKTTTLEEAEILAKEFSKKNLKCVSIWKLRKGGFVFSDKPNEVTHTNWDNFALLVKNFESPFEIYSRIVKNGSEIIEGFPTKELADAHYKEKSYRNGIMKNYNSEGEIIREFKLKL